MLPSFLVIGAMKAGTSSLHRYLAAHPQVFMSTPKELNFFVAERNWTRGLDWYRSHFVNAPADAVAGESSPSYSMYPLFDGVPQRIAEVLPGARLVYVLRDPIERIRSHYLATHYLQRRNPDYADDPIQREHLPIERAVVERDIYVQTSSYALQIERYLEHFPRDRILAVTTGALKARRADVLKRVFRFLGVDPEPGLAASEVTEREHNRTAGKRALRPTVHAASSSAAYRTLAAVLPQGLKQAVRERLLKTDVDVRRAELSPALRAALQERLRPDLQRLRALIGEEQIEGWELL